jgi:hypothetical protein
MALGQEGVKELPTGEAIIAHRKEQLKASGVEAAVLERNGTVAIRYRPLSDGEVRAALNNLE